MNGDTHRQRVNEILHGKNAGFGVESTSDAQFVIDGAREELLDRKPINWGKEIKIKTENRIQKKEGFDLVVYEYEIPKIAFVKFRIGSVEDVSGYDVHSTELDSKICRIDSLELEVESLKRGLDIGKALVENVIHKAKEEKCDRIVLVTEPLSDHYYESLADDHPYHFYSKLGFEIKSGVDYGGVPYADNLGKKLEKGHNIPMVMYLNKEEK